MNLWTFSTNAHEYLPKQMNAVVNRIVLLLCDPHVNWTDIHERRDLPLVGRIFHASEQYNWFVYSVQRLRDSYQLIVTPSTNNKMDR